MHGSFLAVVLHGNAPHMVWDSESRCQPRWRLFVGAGKRGKYLCANLKWTGVRCNKSQFGFFIAGDLIQIIVDEDGFLSFCMHSCINRCMACSHGSGITELQSHMELA
jgi:hypothetical protein